MAPITILYLLLLVLLGLAIILILISVANTIKHKKFFSKILSNFGTGSFVGGLIILHQTQYTDWAIFFLGLYLILIQIVIENFFWLEL